MPESVEAQEKIYRSGVNIRLVPKLNGWEAIMTRGGLNISAPPDGNEFRFVSESLDGILGIVKYQVRKLAAEDIIVRRLEPLVEPGMSYGYDVTVSGDRENPRDR